MSKFSPEEMELLASLPYKVGAWISFADDVEGESDDAREMKALEQCMRAFATHAEEKPFLSSVMKETLRQREKWEKWADQSFNVLAEIKKALPMVRAKAGEKDFKSFRVALMEIGGAVAAAHGEFGQYDDEEAKGFFSKVMEKFSNLSADDAGHPMNVSASEDDALSRLREALKTGA